MTPPAKAGGFSEERLLAPTAASQATAQVSPCGHLSRLAPEGPIRALKRGTPYRTHVREGNASRALRGRTFRCQLKQAVPCPLVRWGRKQLDIVRKAARLAGVPYQTY